VQPTIANCPHCGRLPTMARPYGLREPYGWVHLCPRLVRRVDSRPVQYQTYGAAVEGWNAWCDQQATGEETANRTASPIRTEAVQGCRCAA
jgi:hypothetical protein